VELASAPIAACHSFALQTEVTRAPIVAAIREHARRITSIGDNRKEPLSFEKVVEACKPLAERPSGRLRNLYLAAAISLGFCGSSKMTIWHSSRWLPPSLARQGIGHQLLSRAGDTSQECTVKGEFMGDLPTQYASQQAAAGVDNADACLIFIRPPPGDQELLRMPRSFCIGDERVHISRPGQRRLSTPHT